jgi:hypothetical protein
MSPLPFFGRGKFRDLVGQFTLTSYVPELNLQGLTAGVDNIHPDVFLSHKFTDVARGHLRNLIEQHGEVQQLARAPEVDPFGGSPYGRNHLKFSALPTVEIDYPAEFKSALSGLQLASLRRARAEDDLRLDILLRVALIKFLRSELVLQFNQVLEQCKENLKRRDDRHLERQQIMMRDRFLRFQVNKRPVMRRVAEDLLSTMADVERETVASTRHSLFGGREAAGYETLANRLIFPDSITDPFVRGERYAMFGGFDRDPDYFERVVRLAKTYLEEIGAAANDQTAEALLCVPDNAKALMFTGMADDSPRGRAQKALTTAWMSTLVDNGVMEYAVAAYEVVPILGEYGAVVQPQQLKGALVQKSELKRVEELLGTQNVRSLDKLHLAVQRVRSAGSADNLRYAAKYLIDLSRFLRDVRKMRVLEPVLDSINVVSNARLRELSQINGTLYEFHLPEEERPAESRVINHAVLKADVRDSTRLTQSMLERGLNPASFFSLNFFEPVNKLLPKYHAEKVFIEGDAVILALLESEAQAGYPVARTCVMAREMLGIVGAYNAASMETGLPPLEIGIGVAFQAASPLYLMDGGTRIMISEALNLSDRLSACHKRARRHFRDLKSYFNVFVFQTADEEAVAGAVEDFLLNYNVGGIHLPKAAFAKLRDEISLEEFTMLLPMPWGDDQVKFYRGLVPVGPGVFHPLLVREGRAAQVEVRDFRLVRWADHLYYEVCTNSDLLLRVESQRGPMVPVEEGRR